MSSIVLSIVQVSVNKIALWISVRVDDWTAETAIIANNDIMIYCITNYPIKKRNVCIMTS